MKLYITPDELAEGQKLMRLTKKRLETLPPIVNHQQPILLSQPWRDGNRVIHLVIPTALEPLQDGRYALHFKPLWVRCYTGCHARTSDLRMVVVETDAGKVQIDHTGVHTCTFTTAGAGVGAEAEEEAEAMAAKLIQNNDSHPIVRRLVQYLSTLA